MAPRKKPAAKAAASTRATAAAPKTEPAKASNTRSTRAAHAKSPTAAASKAATTKAAASKATASKAAATKSTPTKAATAKAAAAKATAAKATAAKATAAKAATGKAAAAKAATAKATAAKPTTGRAAARKQAANSRAAAASGSTTPTKEAPAASTPKGKAAAADPPADAAGPSSGESKAKSPAPSSRASKKRPAPSPPTQSKKTARVASGAASRRAAVQAEYDEVWKEVYLAGTEWDQMKDVYSYDWDFDHLDEALTDGDLAGKTVHLFGCTEPQLIKVDEKDEKGQVVPVPVIVAFVCDVAPPATVGLKSVQRATEEIVPMAKLRMAWHAYAPPNVALRKSFKPIVHVLTCTQRKARLRNMGEEDVHTYDYVLPYFIDPEKAEDVDENTVVQVLADLDGVAAPLMCEFDYEMDELAEFVETTLQEQELDEGKHTDALKTAIREAVRATKLKYKKEREERQKRLDDIPQEEKDALKARQVIKFYPANEWPDVSGVKSRFVNRYYGQANEVV